MFNIFKKKETKEESLLGRVKAIQEQKEDYEKGLRNRFFNMKRHFETGDTDWFLLLASSLDYYIAKLDKDQLKQFKGDFDWLEQTLNTIDETKKPKLVKEESC